MTTAPLAAKSARDSLDKVTELLWEDALGHLKSTNNEVLLPSNVTDIIGHGNLDKIKARLCALIGAPVVAFVDESIDALRVMRTPAFSGTEVSVAAHDKVSHVQAEATTSSTKVHEKPLMQAKATKVPRPPNAFILYRQQHHPEVKAAYPEYCNNDISIMLGKQWKDETDEVKAQYKAQAEELKRKHAEDYPDYQYTPRRPSEKKRRTTSRQYPRHARISRLGESPTFTPTASNPILRPGFQNTDITIAGHANEIGVGMGPLGGMDDGLGFSADALNALVQHVGATGTGTGAGTPTDGYMYQTGSGTTICPGPNGAEAAAAADSFEFSDFIADFY